MCPTTTKQGAVPLDMLPGLAQYCYEYLKDNPGPQDQEQQLPHCPSSYMPLDLRNCDPGQGGHLRPYECAVLLADSDYSSETHHNGGCSLDVCIEKPFSDKECTSYNIDAAPNKACIPDDLVEDLIYFGEPIINRLNSPVVHFIQVDEDLDPNGPSPILLHLQSQPHISLKFPSGEDLPDQLFTVEDSQTPLYGKQDLQKTNCLSNSQDCRCGRQSQACGNCVEAQISSSSLGHRCWNLASTGPQPALACDVRYVWFSDQVPPSVLFCNHHIAVLLSSNFSICYSMMSAINAHTPLPLRFCF